MIAGPLHLEAEASRRLDADTLWMDTLLIGSCQRTVDLYRGMGVSAERLALVYYGADASRYDPDRTEPSGLRRELGWPDEGPLVGMVAYFYSPLTTSRWTPRSVHGRCVKGHRDFIRAIPHVLERFPTARFVLVGSGWGDPGERHRDETIALAHSLGLGERVAFLGFRPDVARILRELDVSVQPSLNENLGGTIEALLMGCPTVASRVGGMVDSVRDGVTGVLVEPGQPEDLAAGICRLLADPVAARQLGDNGRALMLERFTLDQTAQRLDGCYRRLAGPTGRGRRGYRPWVSAWRMGRAGLVLGALGIRLTRESQLERARLIEPAPPRRVAQPPRSRVRWASLPRPRAPRNPLPMWRLRHVGYRLHYAAYRVRYAGFRLLVVTRLIGPYRRTRAWLWRSLSG
jgi:hypothetical protein